MPRSPKALLISTQYFPPQVGGISNFLAGITASLGRDNVCVLTGVPSERREQNPHDPNIYRVPSLFKTSRLRKAVPWAGTLAQIVAKDRPDVTLLGSVEDCNLGLWLHSNLRFPFIVFVHGNEVLTTIHEGTDKARLAYRTANRVVAISQYTAELVRKAGAPAERVVVVHPGCDTTTFKPVLVNDVLRKEMFGSDLRERKVILTVGNLVSRKGHDVVIQALPLVKRAVPNCLYLIVGDGPNRRQLEQLARELGVSELVKFGGTVPDSALPDIYAMSDLFVMASRCQEAENDVEGFGLVYLEANACGKPVIGGRSGGVPDAVAEGVSGLLVNPESPDDVSAALIRLLTNEELATRLGEQGRQRVIRDFEWDSFRMTLLKLIDDVRCEGRVGIV